MSKKFRLCAGCVVFNKKGLLLLCNRVDSSTDAWQFPQGGIEKEEKPVEAAQRELFEETGITSVNLVHVDEKPLRYEFTDDIKQSFQKRGIFVDGQDIYFALFFFTGSESEINLQIAKPEFKAYTWNTFDFAINNVISFKKDVYSSIANRFTPLIKEYLKNRS